MFRSCKVLSAIASVWVFGSGVLCVPVAGREVKLAICPQKVPAEPGKWSLLPPEGSLTDGDAAPLYEKAIEALPGKGGDAKINEWLNMPIDQLPVEQVEQALEEYIESLKYVARAVKCRQCNWPDWEPGKEVVNHEPYRRLAFAIRLWARLEIAAGRYEGAILALQTGFGMARHQAQAPTLLQVQIGIATAAAMCREVQELAQREGSPNLYFAFAALPKPFADVEKAIENEQKVASSGLKGRLFSKQYQSVLKPAYDRSRVLAKRFDGDLAALQCIEAIRSYAASHGGQLPGTLMDIAEVSVPKDPIRGEAFRYTRTGSTAVLESAIPEGGREGDKTRYEIAVKN